MARHPRSNDYWDAPNVGELIDLNFHDEWAVREAELQAIVEQMPSGVIVLDRQGFVRQSNPALKEILGVTLQQNRHVNQRGIFNFELRRVEDGQAPEAERAPAARALLGETVREEWMVRPQGAEHWLWVQIAAAPLRNELGEIAGAVEVMTDITAQREAERQLRELSGRFLLAQEEERRRVASELHDDLIQTMIAVTQHLQAHQARREEGPVEADQELREALALCRRAVQDVRRITAGLRPTTLDNFGLHHALLEEVDALRSAGWTVRLTNRIAGRRLPPTVETTVYRVTQEALRNVRKHAGKCKVVIRLGQRKGSLELTIRDSGVGMSLHGESLTPALGLGVEGMRERTTIIGGSFLIESRPGQGTLVSARLPLEDGHGN